MCVKCNVEEVVWRDNEIGINGVFMLLIILLKIVFFIENSLIGEYWNLYFWVVFVVKKVFSLDILLEIVFWFGYRLNFMLNFCIYVLLYFCLYVNLEVKLLFFDFKYLIILYLRFLNFLVVRVNLVFIKD